MKYELKSESDEVVSVDHMSGDVFMVVDSFINCSSIILTKEEALQLAAALVSAAKEVEQ